MQRLVVKTAVKTVLILLGILVVAFAIFNFAFPQHMATAMESLGNYSMAVRYANLRYFYTKDSYDLARCFDDSVLAEDDGLIVEYGEALVKVDNFTAVCEYKNKLYGSNYYYSGTFDYKHRVYSSLSVSYYNTGDFDKALSYALEDNGQESFAFGNAVMVLCGKVYRAGDATSAAKLREVLTTIENNGLSDEEELGYLKYFYSKLNLGETTSDVGSVYISHVNNYIYILN